jgi:hypothetical protein
MSRSLSRKSKRDLSTAARQKRSSLRRDDNEKIKLDRFDYGSGDGEKRRPDRF